MNFKIVHSVGHYDIYLDGDFYCSADTYSEAVDEVEKCLEKRRVESVVMD